MAYLVPWHHFFNKSFLSYDFLQNGNYLVLSFICYLGDMLDAAGGAESSTVTRVRSEWKRSRELLPLLTTKAKILNFGYLIFFWIDITPTNSEEKGFLKNTKNLSANTFFSSKITFSGQNHHLKLVSPVILV